MRTILPIRRVVSALALCCLLTGGTLWVSHQTHAPAKNSVVARNPCALPCFFNITVGKTNRHDVLNVIVGYETLYLSDDLLAFTLIDDEGHGALVSVNMVENGMVENIRVTDNDLFVDIGQISDLLLANQQPARVFRTCDGVVPARFLMTFGTQDELLIELFATDGLTPTTPITLLDISTPGSRSLYDARTSFGCSVETSWQGFAPLRAYLAHTDADL